MTPRIVNSSDSTNNQQQMQDQEQPSPPSSSEVEATTPPPPPAHEEEEGGRHESPALPPLPPPPPSPPRNKTNYASPPPPDSPPPPNLNQRVNTNTTVKVQTPVPTPPTTMKPGPPRWGSRDVSAFEILEQVGEGTYGEVFKARCKLSKETVALKRIRMDKEREGFPITAIREIKILKSLDHPNIVNLKEIITSKDSSGEKNTGSVYLVFEYLDHDMAGLLETPNVHFTRRHIKCYMKQLLDGVHYMHKNKILHRDIKGPNLLLDNQGQLKIADWGLARSWNEKRQIGYTNNVITLWYRPPELLLGETHYGPSVDMWSVGCIFAELLCGKSILPGRDEMDQLNLIYKLCGTPDAESWPEFEKLRDASSFKTSVKYPPRLRETFHKLSPQALDLIERLLTMNPKRRITAIEALDHDYFWNEGNEPIACKPHELPKFRIASVHEYQAKKRRHREQSDRDQSKRSRSLHYYKPPRGRR